MKGANIKVHIDCGRKHCEDCRYNIHSYRTHLAKYEIRKCVLFDGIELVAHRQNDKMVPKYKRCTACLEATIKE